MCKCDPNASCRRVFTLIDENTALCYASVGERKCKAYIVFARNAVAIASGVASHELFQFSANGE